MTSTPPTPQNGRPSPVPDSALLKVTLPPESVMPSEVYLRRLAATLSGRAFYYAQGLAVHSMQSVQLSEFSASRGMPSAQELLSDDPVNPSVTERMSATLLVTVNVLDEAQRYKRKVPRRRVGLFAYTLALKFTVKVEVPVYSATLLGAVPLTQAVVIYNTAVGGLTEPLQEHMTASVVRAMQTMGVTHVGPTYDTVDRMAAPPFDPDSAYAPWACLPLWGVLPLMPVDGRYGDADMDIEPQSAGTTPGMHASMTYTPTMVARAMDSLKRSAWGRGIPPPLYHRWATDPLTRPWGVPPSYALRHSFTGAQLPRDTTNTGQAEREFMAAGVTRAQMLGLRDLPMGVAWLGVDDMTPQHMKRCARAAVPVRHTTYRTRMESIQVEMLR